MDFYFNYINFIIFVVVFAVVELSFKHDPLVFYFIFCLFVGMLNQIQVHIIPDNNGIVIYCTVISVACMLTSMTLLFLQTTVISFSALRLWCPK